jgi:hypothetical protein
VRENTGNNTREVVAWATLLRSDVAESVFMICESEDMVSKKVLISEPVKKIKGNPWTEEMQ